MDSQLLNSGAIILAFWALLKWTIGDKLKSIADALAKGEKRWEETSGRIQTVEVGQARQSGEITGLKHRVRSLEQYRWAGASAADGEGD